MHLASLTISNFRNFSGKRVFEFDPFCTVIHGNNAVGKTNLLEAIHYLNMGQGFREKKLEELATFGLGEFFIEGVYGEGKNNQTLGARLGVGKQVSVGQGKMFSVNHLKKPFKEYRTRTTPVVLFAPSDLLIITGSPNKRRALIDTILCRLDYSYYQAKVNYERGLYKRNKILENFSGRVEDLSEVLGYWDSYLLAHAEKLVSARESLVAFFNTRPELADDSFYLEYQKNVFNLEELERVRPQELRYRRTLVGPQLDEFILYKGSKENGKQLGQYGSRSEQRLGLLWLKLNEVRQYEETLKQKPIMLVDDIFSELDLANSKKIIQLFEGYQTFLTTAQVEMIPLMGKSKTILL